MKIMCTEAQKKEKVKEILLMPIVSSKSVTGITIAQRKDDGSKFILSGQKYTGVVDEDMSDIAIAFYEVVYDGIKILDNKGILVDPQFAGDTMNSYNQIVNREGCSEEKKEEWFGRYHCLANFWILPLEVGRKGIVGVSKSSVSKDYMDGFLIVLEKRYKEYKTKYFDFFGAMGDFEEFCKKQYIAPYKEDKIKITGLTPPDESIDIMEELVEARAKLLSEKLSEKLYNLFDEMGILPAE
jgi:hypothetical protein